jgi:hypothetical protein
MPGMRSPHHDGAMRVVATEPLRVGTPETTAILHLGNQQRHRDAVGDTDIRPLNVCTTTTE